MDGYRKLGARNQGRKPSAAPDLKRKLRLHSRVSYSHHRSGWDFALRSIDSLFRDDQRGVLLDSVIEHTFWKGLAAGRRQGRLPYKEPWVGILHCPPYIPRWHVYRKSAGYILKLETWKRSIEHCRGLYVLSEYMADWLGSRLDVPVEALEHPTEAPSECWTPAKFSANPMPRLVQVGWWLRRLSSLHMTPVRRLHKTMLWPAVDRVADERIKDVIEREVRHTGRPPMSQWDIERMPALSNRKYDALLARNVVFLHLWSTLANNTVVECIVRRTPILVNPLPSITQYLGPNYPLYFNSLEEAAHKADDFDLLIEAHKYLSKIPVERFSGEQFRQTIAQSAIYRSLRV